MYLQKAVAAVEHENAPTPLFRFPPDSLVSQLRGSLRRQGGQKPYATHSATMAVMEASATWNGPVRYNELANRVEYQGAQWTDERTAAGLEWLETHDVATTREVFEAALNRLARHHMYHPIKDYLEALPPANADDPDLLDEILDAYGIDEQDLKNRRDAYVDAMCSWHTARIKRLYEPGCRVDEVLVLSGAQGYAKSGSFKALYPDETWTGTMSANHLDNKDALVNLDGKSIMVFEELPKTRRDKGAFKDFITKPLDNYRRPYGRNTTDNRRQVVFGATHNPVDGFLDDPTGERRLVVIHVARMIKWEWIKANRNRINAWALARYRAKCRCQPDRKHIEQLQEGCWRVDDWQEAVEERVAELERDERPVTLAALYERIGVDLKERRNDGRLPAILRRLGYEPGITRIDGKKSDTGFGKNPPCLRPPRWSPWMGKRSTHRDSNEIRRISLRLHRALGSLDSGRRGGNS